MAMSTNSGAFISALSAAIPFCQRLVDWPRAVLIAPGRAYWDRFVGLGANVHRPRVTRAHLAALAMEHGCD